MLEFGILGPLEVRAGDGPLEVGGPRQRSVLALLLLHANRVVATEAIVDALWGEQPPRTATTSLQNGISQLRKLLGPDVVETRAPGYVLHVAPEQFDLARFERLLARARSDAPAERARTLREALALWHGDPLADFAYEAFAQEEIRRLQELRTCALEELLAAELELGHEADVVPEAEALVARNPLRERPRQLLMLALYRAGRQAEALQVFHDARRVLDEELGLEPGRELQELHRSILRHDGSLRRAGSAPAPTDHYGEVLRALLGSRLVPVLGPAGADAAPDPVAAAAHLARVFDCPPDRAGSLARVSQYVSVTHGVGPLYDELHTLYGGDYEPRPVHRALAALAPELRARGLPQQLLVAAGWDRTLERAFAEAGEPVDVVSYMALGRDRGKFLHVAPDGTARVIDEPNVEIGLTSEERPVVLRIHGGSDPAPARERESFVVSEDDYIDYLAQTEPAAVLPVGLAARLRRSHFLFLGYDLADWSLRVFLRRLWGEERIGYRSWAVAAATDSLVVEYWRQRGVDAFDVPVDEYVQELARRLAEERAVSA
jgi:DNA-binding SARP family transcriptional activator